MPRDFLQRFPDEHAAFASGITGQQASVVLHRAMFLYFLQQHGWLDGDPEYLARPLRDGKASYYRRFLRPLLHEGLARPRSERRRDWGRIPYLGAGLFQTEPAECDIADTAFHRLFAFFDEFRWSLDDASAAVRPELLGTLFEKHVNRRKTGTYYTPEDVTQYIAHNTILPVLFDTAASTPCIASVNDLVTQNLDIRRFVLDRIAGADRESLRALLVALEKITVLDPTCGSGAFLFAALNLLEEVWTACLGASHHEPRPLEGSEKMSGKRIGRESAARSKDERPAFNGGLRSSLLCAADSRDIGLHSFRALLGSGSSFCIRAAILQKNLYGIDLQEEAVELCRLRLLLRLIAAAKPGDELKDLPDLGATIRAGDVIARTDGLPPRSFDVVIGNPPYLPAPTNSANGFVTADCPDIYARVLERAAGLLRDGGRTGMIVPLSLAFSGDFASCRRLLFAAYGTNWFSSFARIPAALFAGDIRVRNTIHLGHKSSRPSREYTTRLHRWFEADRPQLFPSLHYTAFHPELWGQRIPRLNTPKLAEAMERCLRARRRLGDQLSRRPTPHLLYFKKTAYNWLAFCHRLPPCYAADGSPIAQTQFDVLYFANAEERDIAFLFLNGKWAFAFWCVVGDDFHAARWMFADLPVDLSSLPSAAVRQLQPLVGALEKAMFQAVSFKRNAGKRVGTYNLARCRRVTDRSDRIFAECLGLTDAWDDVELLYRQVVKTEFEV